MNEEVILNLWDLFKGYIPDKNKDAAAAQYVEFLLGQDISASSLSSYTGLDEYLDNAINLVSDDDDDIPDYYDEFEEDE